MKYSINETKMHFMLGSGDGPKNRYLSLEGVTQHKQLIETICLSVCRYGYGKQNYTQISYISNFISPFVCYLRVCNKRSPSVSDEWQTFILNFMHFYFGSSLWSKASAKLRMEHWHARVTPIFRLLVEDEIIPSGICIPSIRLRNEVTNQPCGSILNNATSSDVEINSELDKLLVNTVFSKNDGDFLTFIASECRLKIYILKDICLSHWNAMLHDHKIGRTYANQISKSEVYNLFTADNSSRYNNSKEYRLICSPAKSTGHHWLFCIIHHLLATNDSINCIALKSLQSLPFFSTSALQKRDYEKILSKDTALTKSAFNLLPTAAYVYHFAGVLSGVDVAAICTLLIIEHPKLNSHSIANARVLNVREKYFLVSTDDGIRQIFSVDKPRSNLRKSTLLTPLAQEIITEVIKITEPIRRILKANNDSSWRYLFLGLQMGGRLGRIRTALTDHLTCTKSRSLSRMYPELGMAGLKRGTLSYSKIRCTMGVLKWFETGSIKEMSRCLGNSKKVVLEHYLPPFLVDAWNTRIIRRFQNTLLILASANEDYFLEVTDFSCVGDLMHFISQLIFDHKKGSSPVADEIHQRLPKIVDNDLKNSKVPIDTRNGLINLRLSAKAIAYLYAFQEYALCNIPCTKWSVDDVGSTVSPQSLIDIAILIRHTCESTSVSPAIREIIDYPLLKSMHTQAIKLKDDIRERFTQFNLSTTSWGNP